MTEELRQVLLENDRYTTADGQILKNAVVEAALSLRPDLLKLLLSSPRLRDNFFREVEGVLVFDKIRFQRFVMNKNFLPDSYTSFKNRIGLATPDDHFITDSREVVLSWPYKDCMLEGGQTKEESKRQELFWNEILAPDQISILTAPKAFANAKRYDSTGCHPTEQVTEQDNLIIKGNNLLALYSLRAKYAGKVKLIYIDPPYNTGNDSFGYNDSFNHSTWLTFMKNRLEVARDLLSPDGVIFVQCDDNEQAYLKVLMDEIFGRGNFVSSIIWQKKKGGGQDSDNISREHEYILSYTKDSWKIIESLKKRSDEDFTSTINGRKAQLLKLEKWGAGALREDAPTLFYSIKDPNGNDYFPIAPNGAEGRWRKKPETLDAEHIFWKNNKGVLVPYEVKYFDESDEYKIVKTRSIWTTYGTTTHATKEIKALFDDVKVFGTPKPESLLEKIISISTSEGDLVLDYHLGSGTTAAVAHKMGRRYIGVEQMDYIEDIAVARLRKVIEGEQGGISKSVEWQGGGDFVYLELAEANQFYIDRIMATTDRKELLEIWQEMRDRAFLSYKISPRQLEEVNGLDGLSTEGMQKFLTEVLNKNLLYIPLSEVDSEEYALTEADRSITRSFYSK